MTMIEHPSGKTTGDENFPVASWFIAAPLRPHVLAFYRFARNADDVADAAHLSAAEKLHRLDHMARVLEGGLGASDAPAAAEMRRTLGATGLPAIHCHELLAAFRQDAVKSRYADWGELLDYCRLSAAPVGRFLLDLHGESRETWPESDALCAALQILNHLQDCGDDYRQLDRVYLPLDLLEAEGCGVADLGKPRAGPGLRRALDRVAAATRPLVGRARTLPGGLADGGLRAEVAVILKIAERLLERLICRDPLAERVKLGPGALAAAFIWGLSQGLALGRGKRRI